MRRSRRETSPQTLKTTSAAPPMKERPKVVSGAIRSEGAVPSGEPGDSPYFPPAVGSDLPPAARSRRRRFASVKSRTVFQLTTNMSATTAKPCNAQPA